MIDYCNAVPAESAATQRRRPCHVVTVSWNTETHPWIGLDVLRNDVYWLIMPQRVNLSSALWCSVLFSSSFSLQLPRIKAYHLAVPVRLCTVSIAARVRQT